MALYRPSGFIQMTLDEPYRMRGWTESWGCSESQFRYAPQSGWSCDPSYPEVNGGVGTYGGCPTCRMTELQVIANYHTEVTFISNPLGARIFIDGIEWWPGAVTAVDGATFRGVPPAADPTLHTYELRMVGYQSATGTFGLAPDTPIFVTGDLVLLGIRATDIVPDVTTCTAPCNVSVGVTWTNDAATDMEFTPSLMIDGIPVSPAPYPSEILLAGTSVTHAFLVSGLTAASHQICADPNTLLCTTVTVSAAPAAGGGGAIVIAAVALITAAMFMARKPPTQPT